MSMTAYKPDTTVSEEKKLWCAANLADLDTKIVFTENPVELWTSPDGVAFRLAFKITVAPGHSGHFVVRLHEGASFADLKRAKRMIRHAKLGLFNEDMWDRVTFQKGFPGWAMRVAFKDGEEFHRDEVRACTDQACVDEFHMYNEGEQSDSCTLEWIEHSDGYYIVHGDRDPGEKWNAWVDADNLPDGHAGIKAVRDLANDFAWMQGECDRLNEAAEMKEAA